MSSLVRIKPCPRFTALLVAIVILGMSSGLALAADRSGGVSRDALQEFQNQLTSLSDQVLPSVVSIISKQTIQSRGSSPFDDEFFRSFGFPFQGPQQPQERQATSYGSGVIIRADGYVLTNDHVVGNAQKVTVKLKDGREFDGTVTRDPKSDLAIVKISGKNLPAMKLGDSSNVKVGSIVVAVGSPFELDQTVTFGIVSALHRSQGVNEGGQARYYPNLIQTDASINPGNSGGPLVNIDGEVVGINTLITSSSGGNVGIGFAIPANTAKFVMDQLIEHGKVTRGYLGINPVDLKPEDAQRYGVKDGGVLVQTVETGSPADKAGVQIEDVVIQLGDKKISNSIDLRDTVSSTPPGSELKIVVVRDKQQKVLTAKIGQAPKTQSDATPQQHAQFGFSVSDITPDLATQYKLDASQQGVVITSIEQNSEAASAGLQEGIVIVKANDQTVTSVDDFTNATKDLKSGDTLRLDVKAKSRRAFVEITVP